MISKNKYTSLRAALAAIIWVKIAPAKQYRLFFTGNHPGHAGWSWSPSHKWRSCNKAPDYGTALGMVITSLARLGFVGATLTFTAWLGFAKGLTFTFAGSLRLVSSFALTDRPGFFNIFAIAYVPGLANTCTFTDILPLVAMAIITTIARNYICGCPIAAIKLIGWRTCEMCCN